MGYFRIQTNTAHSAKILWQLRLARAPICFDCRDYAKIDCPQIFLTGGKLTPCRQRVTNTFQAQRPREVVSAAARHDQDGKLQFDQLRKMTMHSTVSTEDENRVGLVRVVRWVGKPRGFRIRLERLQVFGGTSRTEDRCGAHVRGRLSEIGVGALVEKAVE